MSVGQRQAAPPGLVPGASAHPEPFPVDGPDGTSTTAIQISEVSKAFGHGRSTLLALDRISLTVHMGEFVCLIGASGCGKSTLLSLAAGLDTPSAGRIDTAGRRVALMFQEPALFPWLTAARNVELALLASGVGKAERGWARSAGAGRAERGWARSAGAGRAERGWARSAGAGRAERRRRAAELLDVVHLGGFGGKRPHELSGGMRQRVAMARALATDADVLLMDEPFGALDAMTRDLLHDELDRICTERGLTVLFVTHNVREAVRLGDRVVVLSSRPGRVIDEFAVPIPGQRRIDSAQVAELAGRITDRLREEMSRHVQAR
jgi:NitT/TauT family transport system ATP-binding protein